MLEIIETATIVAPNSPPWKSQISTGLVQKFMKFYVYVSHSVNAEVHCLKNETWFERKAIPFQSCDLIFTSLFVIAGFEHNIRACCGRGGKYNYSRLSRCGTTTVVNGTESTVGPCKDPSAYVLWDGIHHTEAANEWVFKQIVDGKYSDPPIPLRMACHKQA